MTDGPDAARIRAVVVDDAVLLREGLARVLDEAGIDVVGQFGDPASFLAALPALTPDVVVMDVRMPPTFTDEGVRAAVQARRIAPGPASCCCPSTSRPPTPRTSWPLVAPASDTC